MTSRRWRMGPGLLLVTMLISGCRSESGDVQPDVRRQPLPQETHSATGKDREPDAFRPRPTEADRALARRFVAFARRPSPATLRPVRLTRDATVGLGAGRSRPVGASPSDPETWTMQARGAWGAMGPLSPLDSLARHRKLKVGLGDYPHCASPPVRPPLALRNLRRVSLRPTNSSIDSCLSWFAVDLYLDRNRRLVAVTLDAWEP